MPIDARSLRRDAGMPVPERPDILDEIPFALRDLEPRTNIAPDQSAVEQRLIDLVQDTARADAAFNAIPDTEGGRIVGTDVARFLAPEYATREGRLRHTISTAKPASAYADDLHAGDRGGRVERERAASRPALVGGRCRVGEELHARPDRGRERG